MEAKPNPFTKLTEQWKGLNKTLKWVIIGAAALLVIVLIVVAATSGTQKEEYEILYTGMDAEETAEVYNILEGMEVPYKLEGTGTILVPKGRRDEVKLKLMNEGYPKTGLDYSIFQNASGLGTTDMEKQTYLKFQTEQNIAYQIKQMDKIKNATVMVTLAENSQYALTSSQTQPAQASVVIELEKGEALTSAEANAIRMVVLRSVAGLENENITLADTNMKVYRASTGEYPGEDLTDQVEMRASMQNLINEKVYNLLAPVFGQANITVASNVELDFERKTTESITYSPPGDAENMGIIVSMRQTAERQAQGNAASGVVGFDSNGAAPFYPEDTATDDADYYKYTQELNAEVNEVHEKIEKAMGQVTELTVSVMLDAEDSWDAELDQVQKLVANAVGVDSKYITVMRTSFKVNDDLEKMLAEQMAAEQAALDAENAKPDMQMILIVGGIVLVLIIVIVVLAIRARRKAKEHELELQQLEEEWEAQRALEGEGEASEEDAQGINLDGDVNVALKELQKLATSEPMAMAQLLRNWLSDEY